MAGYCALCRAEEVRRYGTVLNTAGKRHRECCRAAGCTHPSDYPNLSISESMPLDEEPTEEEVQVMARHREILSKELIRRREERKSGK